MELIELSERRYREEEQLVIHPRKSPFIEANTVESSLGEMRNDHIIPVFVKDNETLISHVEFIETAMEAVSDVFRGESIMPPNIRLSHPIKGRVNIPTHVDHLFRRMLTTDSDDVDHL